MKEYACRRRSLYIFAPLFFGVSLCGYIGMLVEVALQMQRYPQYIMEMNVPRWMRDLERINSAAYMAGVILLFLTTGVAYLCYFLARRPAPKVILLTIPSISYCSALYSARLQRKPEDLHSAACIWASLLDWLLFYFSAGASGRKGARMKGRIGFQSKFLLIFS